MTTADEAARVSQDKPKKKLNLAPVQKFGRSLMLPILFAVGIAIGMAKKPDGSTALAGVVGHLVFKAVGEGEESLVLTDDSA